MKLRLLFYNCIIHAQVGPLKIRGEFYYKSCYANKKVLALKSLQSKHTRQIKDFDLKDFKDKAL